jgi:hypothetical protein
MNSEKRKDIKIKQDLKQQYPKAWELMEFLRNEDLLRAEAWSYRYESEWMPRIVGTLAYFTKEKKGVK